MQTNGAQTDTSRSDRTSVLEFRTTWKGYGYEVTGEIDPASVEFHDLWVDFSEDMRVFCEWRVRGKTAWQPVVPPVTEEPR